MMAIRTGAGGGAHPAFERAQHWVAPAIVAVLCVAFSATFLSINLIPDAVRDLRASLAIARGESFPLYGPVIDGSLHLSALWLYVQALPLRVSPSFAGLGLFIGALTSCKFVFAYLAGCALCDRRLGLLLALGAALPSVAAYQSVYLLHPVLVETFVWMALWMAARSLVAPRVHLLYACALAIGIAAQFHPTALFYAPLPWVLLYVHRRAVRHARWHAALLVLPLVCAFLPQLVAGPFADTLHVVDSTPAVGGAAVASVSA